MKHVVFQSVYDILIGNNVPTEKNIFQFRKIYKFYLYPCVDASCIKLVEKIQYFLTQRQAGFIHRIYK